MTLPPTERIAEILAGATKGRRVQFHPRFCPEAEGQGSAKCDSSHNTSLILPSGEAYRGYSTHRHSSDALLDNMAYELAEQHIADAARIAELEANARVQCCESVTPSETVTIDLERESYAQLVEAASLSIWIPPEYFSNDWVSDCCEFLRTGRGVNNATVKPLEWVDQADALISETQLGVTYVIERRETCCVLLGSLSSMGKPALKASGTETEMIERAQGDHARRVLSALIIQQP